MADESEFWWNVHSYTNEYIRAADTKGALIVAWCTAILGVSYTNEIHKPVFAPGPWTASTLAALIGMSLLVVAFLLALSAIFPQLPRNTKPGFIFWGNVRAFESASKYSTKATSASPQECKSQLVDHIHLLSGICQKKYRLLQSSMALGFIGSAITAVLLVCV